MNDRDRIELDSLDVEKLRMNVKYLRFVTWGYLATLIVSFSSVSYAIYQDAAGYWNGLPVENQLTANAELVVIAAIVFFFYRYVRKARSIYKSRLIEKMNAKTNLPKPDEPTA